jgi:hypothetical protein
MKIGTHQLLGFIEYAPALNDSFELEKRTVVGEPSPRPQL